MARLHTSGFELASNLDLTGGGFDTDGLSGSIASHGSMSSIVRSGANALKITGGTNSFIALTSSFPKTASTSYYMRIYFYIDGALPTSSTTQLLCFGISTDGVSARISSAGFMRLYNDVTGVQIGSDSAEAIVLGSWYRLELSVTLNASAQISSCQLLLNGTVVASGSSLTLAIASQICYGFVTTPTSISPNLYLDDIALNDSTGGNQNSFPGEGKVVLLSPTADSARAANWLAGAGGTSNLWDAVNNTPPVGVSEGTATNTSQIKQNGGTLPQAYDATMKTYSAAGIGATATFNAIVAICSDGEGSTTTGTKAMTLEVLNDPVIGQTSFNAGNDANVQVGSFPVNWTPHKTAVSYTAPGSVANAPVVRLRLVSGTTSARVAHVACLGMYVDYRPVSDSLPSTNDRRRTSRRLVVSRNTL